MRPEKPVFTRMSLLPETLSLVSSAGDVIGWPVRAEIGLRTVWLPSLQLMLPNCHTFAGALVVVSLTVKLPVAPGASVRVDGVTTVLKPGTDAVAL